MAGMRLWRLARCQRSLRVPANWTEGDGDGAAPRDLPGQAGLGARRAPRLLCAPGAGARQARARRALRHPTPLGTGVAGEGRPDLSHRGRRGAAGIRPESVEPDEPPRALLGLVLPPAATS